MKWLLGILTLASVLYGAGAPPGEVLRGKLVLDSGKSPTLVTADRKTVVLDGDESTRKVLGDHRLNGYQVEARGHFTSPGHFLIDPFYTRGLVARQNGKIKLITYYCDVCNIRAYTPGPCVCCQKETTLELIDPDQTDH
jgi:hypothetical protein